MALKSGTLLVGFLAKLKLEEVAKRTDDPKIQQLIRFIETLVAVE